MRDGKKRKCLFAFQLIIHIARLASSLLLLSSTKFVFHIVKLLFLIFSAFQELIRSTFWIAIVKMIRVSGGDH